MPNIHLTLERVEANRATEAARQAGEQEVSGEAAHVWVGTRNAGGVAEGMDERHREDFRTAVAFVTHTREYRSSDVLPALARSGYTTTERPHDRETERLLAKFDPDLVVLAIDPRQDSDLSLVRSAGRVTHGTIMVIAPGPHALGLAAALDAGADICLRDTDGVDFLMSQLAVVARRRNPVPEVDDGPAILTVRDLSFDFDRCQAQRNDELIPLTPTEFKILAYLARSAGKVVSPVEILRSVQEYTYSDHEAQEIVKVYIRRIRRKIEAEPSAPNYIVNVRGFGYMLERRGLREAVSEAA